MPLIALKEFNKKNENVEEDQVISNLNSEFVV